MLNSVAKELQSLKEQNARMADLLREFYDWTEYKNTGYATKVKRAISDYDPAWMEGRLSDAEATGMRKSSDYLRSCDSANQKSITHVPTPSDHARSNALIHCANVIDERAYEIKAARPREMKT